MIKITNGVNIFEVPAGAYKNTFKKLGYNLILEKHEVSEVPPESSDEVVEDTSHDEFAELLEKPISQWNKREVKEFAAAKGIDLAGTKTIDEAKDRIKASAGFEV